MLIRKPGCCNCQPTSALNGAGNDAQYTHVWKYFNSVEDGARVSKGWFKVVSAEMTE